MVASAAGRAVFVIGGTGAQGGSVIRALVSSPHNYNLHTITRNSSNPRAQKLIQQGITVHEGDIGDRSRLDSLFKGMDVVFGMTDYWATGSAQIEFEDGKRLIDAAQQANVKLFVWSGLPAVCNISGGKLTKVHHFDSKAAITEYAQQSGVPLSTVMPGCYASNFLGGLGPHVVDGGKHAKWQLPVSPQTKIAILDSAADYGTFVREAIESDKVGGPGTELYACAEELSLQDMAKQWSEVTGVHVEFEQVPEESYGNAEMLEMVKWFEDYGYFGGKDWQSSHEDLSAPVTSWKQFVEQNKPQWFR
ncbi:hypothetical protein OIO90_003697 [Microbotryomycetes sp. JL221]|nr:hypothetical protein OIO90_003697 [Microbotryomycetes sp. JL221]